MVSMPQHAASVWWGCLKRLKNGLSSINLWQSRSMEAHPRKWYWSYLLLLNPKASFAAAAGRAAITDLPSFVRSFVLGGVTTSQQNYAEFSASDGPTGRRPSIVCRSTIVQPRADRHALKMDNACIGVR